MLTGAVSPISRWGVQTWQALVSRKNFECTSYQGVQNPQFERPIWDTYATVKAS